MDSNLPPENNPLPPFSAPPPPPVNRPPPVISPKSPPRPPRNGSGWKVFAFILLAVLALSLLFNLKYLVSSVTSVKSGGYQTSGPRLEEVMIKDVDAPNKIAVINVDGVISGDVGEQTGGYSMVSIIKEQLRRAKRDKEVKAVILKVNSPGGEVLASDEISKAISEFQDKSHKPVVVSMGSLAASGGYYISAPCEWIVANELTITGSIGVIMHGFNYRGLLDKVGVRPEVYKSGKFKDMLSGSKAPDEILPEERQMVQALIDETFEKFKSVVADGRHTAYQLNNKMGQPLSPEWESFADGRILSGKEAQRLGFVDELGDFDVAVKRAEDLAQIKTTHANLIQYQPIFDFSNLFRLFGKSDAKAVKLDLGVDIPKLQAGYLYFLAPTYFH
ncbi:MAG: Signal peptide peptidase SppA, type [Pedosphaera sp.]|nr:Signal peptide peptidase SppA, type [Pedosphaera sp.]